VTQVLNANDQEVWVAPVLLVPPFGNKKVTDNDDSTQSALVFIASSSTTSKYCYP